MSKTKQSFSYTGSVTYSIDNVVLSDGAIALFDTLTGVGGVDYVPYDGALVTVVAGDASASYRKLAPTLNNKLYYLVSNTAYSVDDKATILAAATEIPVVYTAGRYSGQFVFSNPNNYEYVYLLWDYEDSMNTVASYKGETDNRSIELSFGSNIGRAGISFNTIDPDQPTRYQIEWNGEIVADTKYVGVNSLSNYNALIAEGIPAEDIGLVAPYDGTVNNGVGTIEFYKYLGLEQGKLIVSSPFTSSTWIVNKINPYLKSFYISEANGIPSDICAQCPDTQLYHNGTESEPQVGDIIFTNTTGSARYVGDEYLHAVDTTACVTPPVSNLNYVTIATDGTVISKDSCTCAEYASPFIFTDIINVPEGTTDSVSIETLNNPTSWTLVSSNLPSSASFSEGVISYSNLAPGTYTIVVNASNCVATSPNATVSIVVESNGLSKPVLIDIEQFKDTAVDATYVIPTFTLMYFDGSGQIPTKGNKVYFDPELTRPFVGGLKWYYINDSSYVIQVDKYGNVVDIFVYASTTTTTTTTTTLPAGNYYTCFSCQDSSVIAILLDTTSASLSIDDVVKTTDGSCWVIDGLVSRQAPYYLIKTPVIVYTDCTNCTSTTTTTTTSTTTAPALRSFEIDTTGFTSVSATCASTPSYVNYYHNGGAALPAVNNFVYTNSGGTTLFDGGFNWYLIRVSGTTYACLIADTGQVLNVTACGGTTTTTTAPPYYYYNAEKCTDGSPLLLRHQSTQQLTVPSYVKDSNGNCCEIKAVASPGSQNGDILYLYGSCSECAATTTTTTTTSTTTTSTTTTSTTTTTTAAPLFNITLSYSSSQSSVCSSLDINNYYISGAIGVPGNNIFTDIFGSDIAPAGWYLNLITNVAYEWDGSDWTGATKTC
jgi:hypothetical protein